MIDGATNTVTSTVDPAASLRGGGGGPVHPHHLRHQHDGDTVSVISADGDPQPGPGSRFLAPAIRSANHAAFRHGKHASFTVRAVGLPVPSVTEAGKLPPGVRFTARAKGTAVIAGTPAASSQGQGPTPSRSPRGTAPASAAIQRFTLKVS